MKRPYNVIVRNQKRWATSAFRDEEYNLKMAKHTKSKVLKKMYSTEAKWDHFWGNRRMAIVRKAIKKGGD